MINLYNAYINLKKFFLLKQFFRMNVIGDGLNLGFKN